MTDEIQTQADVLRTTAEVLMTGLEKLAEANRELHEALHGESTISTLYLMRVVAQMKIEQDAMRKEVNRLSTRLEWAVGRIEKASEVVKKLTRPVVEPIKVG